MAKLIKMMAESETMNPPFLTASKTQIIVFTRYPVPGQAKTRLIPCLGPEGAADLQRKMTEFTIGQVRQTQIPMEIRYTGGSESKMRQWLGSGCKYVQQGEGDLGERMQRAFLEGFRDGIEKIVIIGSDCPDNRAPNMYKAVRLLDKFPCVLGPSMDGGYYLIGLRTPQPDLFRDINWGSDRVFRQTIEKAGSYCLLPALNDVDEPEDIPPRISVIIPALNEEATIRTCLHTVKSGFNIEIIVVDGGSHDNTTQVAEKAGAVIFTNQHGRAMQMNLGAENATGEILLFLHADSILPPAWDRQVREVMRQKNVSLGHFQFTINGCFRGKRWVEFLTNFRSFVLKKPYGDQGLFLSRNVFNTLGGYPAVPILEDLLLVKRAGKLGHIRQTSASLLTSGRRWIKHGVVKTTFINQAVLVAAAWGGDLHKLKDTYQKGENPLRVLFNRPSARKGKNNVFYSDR